MLYVDPKTVTSPRDYLRLISVVFDGGPHSISIAEIKWEGAPAYAYRWNIARREWDDPEKINHSKVCNGYPVSRSHPAWSVLPSMFDQDLIVMMINKETLRLKRCGYIE